MTPDDDWRQIPRFTQNARTGGLSVTAFHEKAGRSQVSSFFILLDKGFSPTEPATVAMLPSALSRSDLFRSAHVGRSRFSRCCYLFGALSFHLKSGTRARRLTQSLELGIGPSSWKDFVFRRLRPRSLDCCCAMALTLLRSPTGNATAPPTSCSRHDCSPLAAPSSTFSQLQTPAAQITVDTKQSQDYVALLAQ